MSVRGIALAVVCLLSFTLDAGCNEASAETTKVHYGSRSTEVLTVFPQAGADHPIVVLVHGGTWREQSKETMLQTTAEAIQKRLSATVVDVNYPQYPELEPSVAFPVEPEAVQRATEWALANGAAYGGSSARLALVGLSAGGNLAALAAQKVNTMAPGTVKALVSSSGPMNLWREILEAREGLSTFGTKVANALGCRLSTCAEALAQEWSPRFHIAPSCPPTLLATYEIDKVPRSGSEEMAAALTGAGCTARLVVLAGKGHAPKLGAIGGYAFLEAYV